jgi:peroxiredoxin
MKLAFVAVLMALLSPLAAGAETKTWDVGPAVGARVPALHATDLKGAPVSLGGLSGKNGLVLVFFRSAKWCPYCQKQLMDLKAAPEALAPRGYKLAAISYDPTDVLTGFTEKWAIPYPLLSDAGSTTIDAWKLRDVRYKPDSFAWGVPYASIYVVSPKGVLRAKLAEEDYKVRPPLSAVLEAIDGLPQKR